MDYKDFFIEVIVGVRYRYIRLFDISKYYIGFFKVIGILKIGKLKGRI